jgi:predicted transcriptional regulator
LATLDFVSPAAFRGMLERDRQRAGLSIAKLSWQLGVSVREYRELVEGEAWPSYDVWERIEEFSGWPRAVVAPTP